ncbi:glycine dehydrogenase [Ilumatobacter coccineus YM16-304]|uniref:Glycine dehydrogenase (decarboxylating) n=1 Tax=Ilumatobacter coccineus (strain NBRC 103263 / KCTC 29153 / YM16-304) TaxID=1313172 RepID=A0A6C7E911_ILUCY|nr:aminomethyl-transferring glycine dehydrogenase [Ilumatobacter coccineus]BAN02890.1 glycine dehydrogenase [Ilumatobacter coccineus YM16-304]
MPTPISELFETDEFVRRHIGPAPADVEHMLSTLGVGSTEELLDQTLPPSIRSTEPLALGEAVPEVEALRRLRVLADKNEQVTSLIGMGYTGTITPPVIARNVLENPAWYTAYTPYQPEISQGRLEAILNFQTVVTELTGLDVANASLLDEGTAAAEAMTMARRQSKAKTQRFFVHHDTHPQTLAVLHTRAEPVGVELVVGDVDLLDDEAGVFGALFSTPTSSGAVVDWTAAIERVHELGGVAAVVTDPLACVLATPPGRMGADIAVGSAQRFGVPMGFGGPHAAFVAAREKAARSMPGRIVGVSTDTAGRPALRLALQTREQHIRREKATSNICTAQVLLANIAGLYAAWHGPEGLRRIAERVQRLTSIAAAGLRAGGLDVVNDSWFDTLTVRVDDVDEAVASALDAGFNIRRSADSVGITFDETSTLDTVAAIVTALGGTPVDDGGLDEAPDGLTSSLRRSDDFMTQSVFARYHSEHEMLRYLRRLSDKDLALDRTMIPLGSCTMKLNATSEMVPITWPEFADIHPFAPDDQTVGYREMIADLEQRLATITGYDAVSVQPNAGSQGEFAGLLAIRAFHRSQGDDQRTVCLIPESAHGTNAASAVMAGFDVVVVACDDAGNVDVDDLESKIDGVADQLGALMITYPSTHGVFETAVGDICARVHDAGGQVYVDGANLNALVGLAQPGKFGADVSHLNLHKTFCIPHGGGGPGVGPVGVREHLRPFLPGHPLRSDAAVGAVSAAPHGSAGILPIPWMYLEMMGGAGLTQATEVAIIAANYIAARLDEHYPVLYRGEHGRVAHECIVDLRTITKDTGVSVDDVAKRLMDYGFHAPTMSFPVAGTLMIEPTESETVREIDRFCDAMIAIRTEIERVASGEWAIDDSPLRHAPHTSEELLGDWERPYSRELGAFPVDGLRQAKYFPPVSRIDGAYGDRNLVCSCEPLEALARPAAPVG